MPPLFNFASYMQFSISLKVYPSLVDSLFIAFIANAGESSFYLTEGIMKNLADIEKLSDAELSHRKEANYSQKHHSSVAFAFCSAALMPFYESEYIIFAVFDVL